MKTKTKSKLLTTVPGSCEIYSQDKRGLVSGQECSTPYPWTWILSSVKAQTRNLDDSKAVSQSHIMMGGNVFRWRKA